MPVPQLTEEQRKIALARSLETRKQRAELKAALKAGEKTLAEILSKAKEDTVIGKIKVLSLLRSLPGVGKVKALSVMEKVGIAEARRVAGLGSNQIQKLIDAFK
jgi:hypothetical protein